MNKKKIIYLLLCMFVILSGCKKDKVVKQLPVYLGMVVSSDDMNEKSSGDHNETNIIDPFDESDGNIVDEIEKEIGLDESEELDYYVDLETPMLLTVKLFNPEKYEFLSLVINGIKYQKHQFEKSSDFENIIIKLSSGSISGVKEFKLTEILFYNGKSINKLAILENETIKIGINYEKEPSIKVVDTKVNATSTILDVSVRDYEKVINDNDGMLQVVLYDGKSIIHKYNLKDGTNEIVFDKLMINTLYQYAIYSYCDLLNGEGKKLKILAHDTFVSEEIIEIKDVVRFVDGVRFDLVINDADKVGSIKSIELYKDDQPVKSLSSFNVLQFYQLNSNTDYSIRVVYSYDTGTKFERVVEHSFKTIKETPTLKIEVSTVTKDSFDLRFISEDKDKAGNLTRIELYKDSTPIRVLEDGMVSDLNSNTKYTIKAFYKYNIDNEDLEMIVECNVTTQAKVVPVLDILVKDITQDAVTFDILKTDPDEIGAIEKIELILNGNPINSTDLSNLSFGNLLSNNSYQLEVTYPYDLKDGVGLRELVVTKEVRTLVKTTPTVSFGEIVADVNSLSFDYDVVDVDEVGYVKIIQLYNDTELVHELVDTDPKCFSDLMSNNLYSIKLIYEYDLNDGTGLHEITISTTKATEAEEIVITGCTVLNTETPKINEEIHLRISFDNPSEIVIDSFIINDQLVKVVSMSSASSAVIKFTPEYSGGKYVIHIEGVRFNSYGNDVSQNVKETFSKEVLILGEIYAVKIYNEEENSIGLLDKDQFLFVEIDNPTQYSIFSLTIKINQNLFTYSSNEIETVDGTYLRIKFPNSVVAFGEVYQMIEVESIRYGLDSDNQKELSVTKVSSNFAIMKSLIARDVQTIEDLVNLKDGYVYNLRSNIDLSTTPWLPRSFCGILYGNGYEIQNMSIVIDNDSNKDQNFGLFSSVNGKISGVTLSDIYVSIKTKGNVYFGGLGGVCKNSIIVDNHVTGIINIDTTYTVNADGIIGNSFSSVLFNNIFLGSMNVKEVN